MEQINAILWFIYIIDNKYINIIFMAKKWNEIMMHLEVPQVKVRA